MAAGSPDDRSACPFLLKLFYRTGAFHRPDEFVSPHQLSFVPVYTFPTCSLNELAHYLAAATEPAVLPKQSIGTRIAFRIAHAGTRGAIDGAGDDLGYGGSGGAGTPRFIMKDLGSVVIGGSGSPGAPTSLDAVDGYVIEEDLVNDRVVAHEKQRTGAEGDADVDADDGHRTLASVRFVVGDYISCAILPPLANGCVAPASDARSGRGSGIGEATTSRMPPSAGPGGRYNDFRTGRKGRNGPGGPSNFNVPTGEWRRGDALPDGGAWLRDGGRGGGGGGGGGRGGRGWRRGGRGDRW